MILTNAAIELMGYERIPDDKKIEARFYSLKVYEVKGISKIDNLILKPIMRKEAESETLILMGDNLNSMCRALIDDDYVDNENEWIKERKTNPPFLMILTSLIRTESCTSGYWKNQNNEIHTLECFTTSKDALAAIVNTIVPTITIALSASLSTPERPVIFKPITHSMFGMTPDNKTVKDLIFKGGNVEITISGSIDNEKIASSIEASVASINRFHSKVGYFFESALKEEDSLKKFLYYFFVLEVHINQVYKGLDLSAYPEFCDVPKRIEKEASKFFYADIKETTRLLERFLWCSLLKWKDITDEDIALFKLFKKTRDQFSHGEKIDLEMLPLSSIQKLILKILKPEINDSAIT